MKKILITGGAGFIGINASKYFIEQGWFVIIFDNFSRALVEENIKWLKNNHADKFRIVKGDVVTDLKELAECINEADLVLHLAAQVAVTTSITDPYNDLKTNVIGTFNVLESIRKSNNKPPLIYSSTNKVYGDLSHIDIIENGTRYDFKKLKGITENINLDFHSPYGCSKGAADQYARDYSRIYGLKTVVLRQSCIYGEHQFGVEDQGWVAWFIIACLQNKKITIYGNGKQVRDILYVGDLVRAYNLVYKNIATTSGKIYNVGGGYDNSLSLLEFINLLPSLTNAKIDYSFSDWRPGDQPIFISDSSKINADIGWQPAINKNDGLKKIAAWLKENISLFIKK